NDPERPSWTRVVDAVEAGDHRELATAILELSDRIEWQGFLHGARELHRLGYDVAVSIGDAALAVDAARFVGRACRRLSDWEDAFRWYGVARAVAAEAGMREREAIVIDGLGNTVRDRGNLPRARELYEEVLEIGRELASREVQAKAHQNLAVVEKHAGRTDEAIRHGWAAVDTYESDRWKLAALADLGDIFLRSGELGAS
ncbi:MAG: tetratricopeptide repeat protein, partial [Gemmatimonadetes bacterium]|nr:tetratricopeptide repeat protein [Gemmatimonadota bacterium]NIR77751.1 tetratricopeptide repeat protein [Gemmatimonadota bacterium]NIT89794.1 tetratricopeptide repeat protein [Gemmatimonadota bacterium]NIU30121.1 tetratricopeptide repeat protein [Gemmatimonadota bacterium]NIU37848.1 tetratricopeptide repeat protein [Gemmatimonadota bacterium]